GDLGDGLVKRLVDAFGEIAAPLGLEAHEMTVDGVEVIGQVEDFGDVGVAAVAERDQADLDARSRLAGSNLVADGPDFLLGRTDETAHGAGGVQAKDDFNLRPGTGLFGGLVGKGGAGGKRTT